MFLFISKRGASGVHCLGALTEGLLIWFLKKGEVISVITHEEDWWIGYNATGQYGFLPHNYVRVNKVL